ncbi:hypothetical protein [Egbenema bharatensis]|uniref:hypothetical protein n=1 Tax=Egbenema bharatensis TaxID=3463334 RepID=UPI003A8BCF0B
MRPKSDLWQGDCGDWQNQFIRENLLLLGHAAWQGFTTQGQGMVVCSVADVDTGIVNWNSDIVEYTVQFVPLSDISAHLQTLNLETTLIGRLLDTVQTYDPGQEILLLIDQNGRVDINLLQHLATSPADCYQQVQRRWWEFQLGDSIPRRMR